MHGPAGAVVRPQFPVDVVEILESLLDLQEIAGCFPGHISYSGGSVLVLTHDLFERFAGHREVVRGEMLESEDVSPVVAETNNFIGYFSVRPYKI